MSEFGAGPDLNENWDFEVNSTGDIATTIGVDELEKDIAFNVARRLDGEIGRRRDRSTEKRIQVIVEDIFAEEVRIDSVVDVTVREIANSNSFEVVAEANAGTGGSFELVFEV